MEGTVTFGTHVGFEPRVGASVNTEFPPVAEGHRAHTGKLLLGVGPLMSRQYGDASELLGAQITAVWLLACVDPLVNPKI